MSESQAGICASLEVLRSGRSFPGDGRGRLQRNYFAVRHPPCNGNCIPTVEGSAARVGQIHLVHDSLRFARSLDFKSRCHQVDGSNGITQPRLAALGRPHPRHKCSNPRCVCVRHPGQLRWSKIAWRAVPVRSFCAINLTSVAPFAINVFERPRRCAPSIRTSIVKQPGTRDETSGTS